MKRPRTRRFSSSAGSPVRRRLIALAGPGSAASPAALALEAHALLQPGGKAAQAGVEIGAHAVAEQALRLVDVGPGAAHLARLPVLPVDPGLDVEHLFQLADGIEQADGAVVAEIEHLVVAAAVGHRGAHAADDLVPVGEIALGRAIAVHRDRLAGQHEARELVDRQVRPLPLAKYGEEAQADEAQAEGAA